MKKWILLAAVLTSTNAFAWLNYSTDVYQSSRTLKEEALQLAKKLSNTYNVKISYGEMGNPDFDKIESTKVSEVSDGGFPFGIIMVDRRTEAGAGVALAQLKQLEKALEHMVSKNPDYLQATEDMEFVIFATSFRKDSDLQLSFVNGNPIWACEEDFKTWKKGIGLIFSSTIWKEVLDRSNAPALEITAIVGLGSVMAVLQAVATVSCFPGDIARKIAQLAGMDISKRAVIFEAQEIETVLLKKFR